MWRSTGLQCRPGTILTALTSGAGCRNRHVSLSGTFVFSRSGVPSVSLRKCFLIKQVVLNFASSLGGSNPQCCESDVDRANAASFRAAMDSFHPRIEI
ncbi:hypothetical protein BDV19DRAFT_360976 [Aspergillus venezuelensis]